MGELQHMAAENKRRPPQQPRGQGLERQSKINTCLKYQRLSKRPVSEQALIASSCQVNWISWNFSKRSEPGRNANVDRPVLCSGNWNRHYG